MADYGADLAYIHDAGFLNLAEQATPIVVEMLRERGIEGAHIVELGCGSGATAAALAAAGHSVLGIDASQAMIQLARVRAPGAHFRLGSWTEFEVPRCDAVLAIGEVLGYTGTAKGTKAELRSLFGRIATALRPGGLFIFDLATPGRVPGGEDSNFRVGEDWAILHTASEDARGGRMVRRITTFRRIGGGATYDGIKAPVLDLYGSKDLPPVLAGAKKRAASIKGNPASKQVVIKGADHFFAGQDDAMVKTTKDFLDSLK